MLAKLLLQSEGIPTVKYSSFPSRLWRFDGFGFWLFSFSFKSMFVKPWTLGVLGSGVKVKNVPAPREVDQESGKCTGIALVSSCSDHGTISSVLPFMSSFHSPDSQQACWPSPSSLS